MTMISPHRKAARTYGIFFLLAFLSYGIGSGITANLSGDLTAIADAKATFTIGILLMAVVHTAVNIGLASIMVPILKPFGKAATYGYFALAIAATTVAVIGAIFMVLLMPLSDAPADTANIETFTMLLNKGGFYAYQISMTIWGLGGLLFVSVLCKSGLVPRFFPIWGFIGYVIFMTGTTAEMFGYPVGVLLSAPGGLFEVALSLWLIFKGFNPSTKS